MTEQEQYVRSIAGVFKHCLKIVDQRSLKYTGTDAPFSNFEAAAEIADTDVMAGVMTRFGDKVGRIKEGLRGFRGNDEAKVFQDETFRDSISDAINYLAILLVYVETGAGADFETFLEAAGMVEPRQASLPLPEPSAAKEEGNWFKKLLTTGAPVE